MNKISPKIWNIVGVAWALGGVVALLAYLDSRKATKLKEEVLKLDQAIKQHELDHRRKT
tara:strand:+ start:4478 stop:4654 length:177 start_codon:yes stop_codon:yes gene_type:complete